MAKRVTWTESAWSDLSEVADYIAKDSPNYAAAFVQEVKDVSRTLKALAKRGRIVLNLRTRMCGSFLSRLID